MVTIFLQHYGQLDVLRDTPEVVLEPLESIQSVRPEHKSVIHIVIPTEQLIWNLL